MKALFWYADGSTREGHVPIPPPPKWIEAVLSKPEPAEWAGYDRQEPGPIIRQRVFELRKSLPSVEAGLKQGVIAHYVEVTHEA